MPQRMRNLLHCAGYLALVALCAEALAAVVFCWYRGIDVRLLGRVAAEPNSFLRQVNYAAERQVGGAYSGHTSIDAMVQTSLVADADLQLREQAVWSATQLLKRAQAGLAADRQQLAATQQALEQSLATISSDSARAGRHTARVILERMPPRQAKDQLLLMISCGEPAEVVTVLTEMQPLRRTRIVDEFKSDDEVLALGEVLELLRKGGATAAMVESLQRRVSSAAAHAP